MKTIQRIIYRNGGLKSLKECPFKVKNPPFMDLVIEYVGEGPRGFPMVSVAHYGRQNGDLMRDPDVVFEVGDAEFGEAVWGPISFRNDYAGIDQVAVFKNEKGQVKINPQLVLELKDFARLWDRNLEAQGFDKKDVEVEKFL